MQKLLTASLALVLTLAGGRRRPPRRTRRRRRMAARARASSERRAIRRTSRTSTMSTRTRRRAARCACRTPATFDTLNPILPKGVAGRRARPDLRDADDAGARRVRHRRRIRADRRRGALPGRLSSVTYRLNPEAKWHDGEPITADDVVWSFNKLDRAQPDSQRLLLPARRQGGEDRRARGDLHLRRDGQPRAAAHRRPAPRPAASTGGKAPTPTASKRDIGESTLEPPLGSGPVQGRARSCRAARSSTSACRTSGARTCTVNIGTEQFRRRSATSTSAT